MEAKKVIKQVVKKVKKPRIVILKVGSSILRSLGSHEVIEGEMPAEEVEVVPKTT